MQTEPQTPDAIYRQYWPGLIKALAKSDCRHCGQTAEDFAQSTLANVILKHQPSASPNELAGLVGDVLRGVLTRHLSQCVDKA